MKTVTPFLVAVLFLLGRGVSAQETAHAPGWVVLPLEEYRTLHARAYPTERGPEPPPVDATLTRVDYDLRIESEVATGRATLTVDVLKDGWVRVAIPTGLLVRKAELDGKTLALVSSGGEKGSSQLSAVLSHAGRAVLSLDIVLPVTATAGQESLMLPTTGSGVTRASVEIPQQGVDIRLSGGILSDHSESGAGSKWLAYGNGSEALTLTWRRKTEDHRGSEPLRWRGSLTQLVSLGEDSTSIYAETNAEVVQGLAREIRIRVPEGVTINQVMGALVADWNAKGNELVVTFLEPVEHSARFVLTGEARLPRDGKIEVPLLRLIDPVRETGGVGVEVTGAGEIKDLKPRGLENADASDLGEIVSSRQSPSLSAFRFRVGGADMERALTVDVTRYTQQAVLMANIEEARYRVLASKDGKTLVEARYAVRNNQRNFVKITLPQGAVLWSASLAGKPIRPGQSPDGNLLLPLEKARGGEEAPAFALEVLYLTRAAAWGDRGKIALPLPAVDLPISRTGLVLFYPPLLKMTADPGSFRTETYADPTSVALNGGGGALFAGEAKAAAPQMGADQNKDTQSLVDQFWAKSKTGRAAGILPIRVSFPAFGPSLFLVSELTSENQAPAVALSYQPEKKGGAR
jgi:hypothetical protein